MGDCVYNSPNIPLKWMCNYKEDCSEGSDEIDCGNYTAFYFLKI